MSTDFELSTKWMDLSDKINEIGLNCTCIQIGTKNGTVSTKNFEDTVDKCAEAEKLLTNLVTKLHQSKMQYFAKEPQDTGDKATVTQNSQLARFIRAINEETNGDFTREDFENSLIEINEDWIKQNVLQCYYANPKNIKNVMSLIEDAFDADEAANDIVGTSIDIAEIVENWAESEDFEPEIVESAHCAALDLVQLMNDMEIAGMMTEIATIVKKHVLGTINAIKSVAAEPEQV